MKRTTSKAPASGSAGKERPQPAIGEPLMTREPEATYAVSKVPKSEPEPIVRATARRLRVGLLFGGRSVEHEISVLSARSIAAALDPRRYDVVPIGIDPSGRWELHERSLLAGKEHRPEKIALAPAKELVVLPPYPESPTAPRAKGAAAGVLRRLSESRSPAAEVDVVFPILHGTYGEDGTVQGLLELAGVPYVGSGVLGSAVGMDKDVQKRLLREAGLPVARFRSVRASEWQRDRAAIFSSLTKKFVLPAFVKPANAGSSVGVSKVKTPAAMGTALDEALRFDEKALVEEAIFGREIECAVLGDEELRASVPGEVVPRHEFYSYEAKYLDPNGAELIVPAKLTAAEAVHVQTLATSAFRVLDLCGMARVDFFVAGDNARIYINEVNTIPGFTSISMYPRMFEASGIPYAELLERLIEIALRRHARRQQLRTSYFEKG